MKYKTKSITCLTRIQSVFSTVVRTLLFRVLRVCCVELRRDTSFYLAAPLGAAELPMQAPLPQCRGSVEAVHSFL